MRRAVSLSAAALALLGGCATLNLGVSLPIPGGGVGVSVGSDGRVGGGVTIGGPGGSVTVGGTVKPPRKPPAPRPDGAASAADAAASAGQ